jgi:hypothetical protein
VLGVNLVPLLSVQRLDTNIANDESLTPVEVR